VSSPKGIIMHAGPSASHVAHLSITEQVLPVTKQLTGMLALTIFQLYRTLATRTLAAVLKLDPAVAFPHTSSARCGEGCLAGTCYPCSSPM
jgi:hypothetical protein